MERLSFFDCSSMSLIIWKLFYGIFYLEKFYLIVFLRVGVSSCASFILLIQKLRKTKKQKLLNFFFMWWFSRSKVNILTFLQSVFLNVIFTIITIFLMSQIWLSWLLIPMFLYFCIQYILLLCLLWVDVHSSSKVYKCLFSQILFTNRKKFHICLY